MPKPPEFAALTIAPVVDGGVRRRLPLELDGRGNPIAVALQPDEAFPDGIVFGDSAKRSDRRTAQIIWDDWGGGVGQDEYTETEGLNTATDSTLDTRFQKSLVLPPRATQLGNNVGPTQLGQRGVYLGFPTARHLTWNSDNPAGLPLVYDPLATVWAPCAVAGQGQDAIIAGDAAYLKTATGLYRSTDGAVWVSLAHPFGGAPGDFLLCQYDNKLWVVCYRDMDATLYAAVGYQAGTAPTWSTLAAVTVGARGDALAERPRRLFVWKFPPNPGYPALWLQTTHRLFYYDEAGQKWAEWARTQRNTRLGTTNYAASVVARRTGNLYVAPGERAQRVIEYTGNTQDVLGPNERGGLPAGAHTQFVTLDSNDHWLLAWGTSAFGSGNANRVWAMGDSRGWHCVYTTINPVAGGWVGPDALYVIEVSGGNGTVRELPFPDETTIPRNATGAGKTYQTGATYALETAWTDGGTPYTNKRAHWCFLDARLPDGSPGIPANTDVTIRYMTDRNPTWTLLAGPGPGDAWPVTLQFFPTGGQRSVGFKRIRFRVELDSFDPVATPNIATLALHFTRRPKRRYGYSFRVDLRDEGPAFRKTRKYNGCTASFLRTWLLGLVDNDEAGQDDPLVTFEYGGYGNLTNPTRRKVELADMVVTPIEDADSGLGRYQITLRDLTPPSSG